MVFGMRGANVDIYEEGLKKIFNGPPIYDQ